ncbi:hypothetical protein PTTG_09416, partial [Puccinia triticina 1-1 BBBD Race 1]
IHRPPSLSYTRDNPCPLGDQLLPLTNPKEILQRVRAEQRRLHQETLSSTQPQQIPATDEPGGTVNSNDTTNVNPAVNHLNIPLVVGSAPAPLPSGLQLSSTQSLQALSFNPPPLIPSPPNPPEESQPLFSPNMEMSDTPANTAANKTKPGNSNHPEALLSGHLNKPNPPPPPPPSASSNLSTSLTRDCMKMLMLLEGPLATGRSQTVAIDHVDHRCFNTSDAPKYVGPYMEVKPFLVWINGVEIFFMSKDVTKERDKILIIGRLILETNLLLFFQAEAQKMIERTWHKVKKDLFEAALPLQWRTTLQKEVRYLKMLNSKTFNQYTTRSRTLQRMINFKQHSLSDFQLAEGMSFGLPTELENKVNKLDLLKRKEFNFKEFIRRQNPNIGNIPREEYIWRIHSYLDLVGKGHHSYRGPVEIPPTFVVPPKPVDYIAPRAWNKPQGAGAQAGPAQPGQPTGRPAGVAAIVDNGEAPQEELAEMYDDTEFEEYHAAAIATLDDIESSLTDNMNAGCRLVGLQGNRQDP